MRIHLNLIPIENKFNGLTFSTTSTADRDASRNSPNKWDVISAAILVALIPLINAYFSG